METRPPQALDDEVWRIIHTGVEAGELTEEEAATRYEAWKAGYVLGKTATEAAGQDLA